MIWDGNGYPVKGCCAACRRGTPAFGPPVCGKPWCVCHEEAVIGSERPDLGPLGDDNGSGVLGDSSDSSTPQAGVQPNADSGNQILSAMVPARREEG